LAERDCEIDVAGRSRARPPRGSRGKFVDAQGGRAPDDPFNAPRLARQGLGAGADDRRQSSICDPIEFTIRRWRAAIREFWVKIGHAILFL
jgi:hypothetical protein